MSEACPIPASPESELGILCSLILSDGDPAMWSAALARLLPGSFLDPVAEMLWPVMREMRIAGSAVDGLTLRAELQRRGLLDRIGGTVKLAELMNTIPSWVNWETYLAAVVDARQRREIIVLCEKARAAAYVPARAGGALAGEIAADAVHGLGRIIQGGGPGRYEPVGAVVERVCAELNAGHAPTPLVATGFPSLDQQSGGIGLGEMWILAARPSMGKSTLARQVAVNVARARTPVGFISLEETPEKMARNLLAAESGIENQAIRAGNLAQEQWVEVERGMLALKGLPLFLCDSARNINDVAAMAATMQAREGCNLIIIDYLQRIHGRHGRDRYEAVTELSIAVSDIAKQNRLAVLCLCQLNRGPEARENKEPTMADLRDSGQIEQDADAVLLLYRKSYYDGGAGTEYGDAELIVGKMRDGVRGNKILLRTQLRYQRFVDPQDTAADVAARRRNEIEESL
jgi:replicative DNA helicase